MLLTGLPAHAEHFWKETDVKTVHRSYLGAQVGETLIFQWALFSPEREMFNSIYILLLFFFFSVKMFTHKITPAKCTQRSLPLGLRHQIPWGQSPGAWVFQFLQRLFVQPCRTGSQPESRCGLPGHLRALGIGENVRENLTLSHRELTTCALGNSKDLKRAVNAEQA